MSWIPADEAARMLGVKRRTLYTYVSRGWLATRPLDGRRKLYRRSDVVRLRERANAHKSVAARAAAAMTWGEPVLTTAISGIDRDGPYYRGTCALDLTHLGLRELAALLWDAPVLSWPTVDAGSTTTDLRTLRRRLDDLPLHDDPLVTGARIVASLHAWTGLPDRPRIRAAHVLSADHGLNASTFTARVVASTGADLVSVVVAALAAFSGPRHGTASIEVARRLETSHWPGEEPGFGHPLYPDGDPRAEALLELVDLDDPRLHRLRDHLALRRQEGLHPTLDVGLLAVTLAEDLPVACAPLLFLVGRTIGWVAHALEQRATRGLLRPRGRYAGWPEP